MESVTEKKTALLSLDDEVRVKPGGKSARPIAAMLSADKPSQEQDRAAWSFLGRVRALLF